MEKYDGCTVELDTDGNDGDVVVPGLAPAMILAMLMAEIDMEEDAMGQVPVEVPSPREEASDLLEVPGFVLEVDEQRCHILRHALKLRNERVSLLVTYRNAKAARQAALDRVNRNKEAWRRMTAKQRREHALGFKAAQDKNWAAFHEAKEAARNAWAAYEQRKQDSEGESVAWELYFGFVEAHPELESYSWALSQLRQTEFNRFDTTGHGSDMHDEAWVNQDLDNPGTRIDDEFAAHCEYWGSNRLYLPAKDRRRAMYQARKAKVPTTFDQDAFEALVASLD